MGWFSKAWKKVKKVAKKVGGFAKKWTGLGFLEDIKDGITGKSAARAAAEGQRQAEEEARQQRVAGVQGAQFADRDAQQQGANVSLGTADTDDSLEEQLRRMRGGKAA